MNQERKLFSICIPSYNRAKYLSALLDSILLQSCRDFEIVICEDCSPEREKISDIVEAYKRQHPSVIHYHENRINLGYDANIRRLVEKANGTYCFFMGNDDLMCPDALGKVADIIRRNPNLGVVLKSYAVFSSSPKIYDQEIKYFSSERVFFAGTESIAVCFRRSGVISGYIVHRDDAHACATSDFDGTLYYQMHLTGSVLVNKCAVSTPEILVLCRDGEPPEFGNSKNEKSIYTPGRYTPQARLNMVKGALMIAKSLQDEKHIDVMEDIFRDYANFFYPYIKDQLSLPPRKYFELYRGYSKMGFGRFPQFHFYSIVCYVLGEKHMDSLIGIMRKSIGRSMQFGISGK